MIGKIDIYIDLIHSESPVITKQNYMEYVLRMVNENDFYDALAHIDYPSRVYTRNRPGMDEKRGEIYYGEHMDMYDAIFSVLVKNKKPLEINTRRLSIDYALENAYEVFTNYKRCGGRRVTIGSDAHNHVDIGRNFDTALDMARDVGLTPVYFRERRMVEF